MPSERWRSCWLISKASCTGHFRCLFLMIKVNCCYNKGLPISITVAVLWTNTCCSHPQLGEDIRMSAIERLHYEMGLKCDLKLVYSFIYKEPVENNLIEHELDYVFVGQTNQNPVLNQDEVQSYKWISPDEVLSDINEHPSRYTVWFKRAFPELMLELTSLY